ncbi:MAG: hypothetical protein AB1757_17970 [Acidobacteriota bacterium]
MSQEMQNIIILLAIFGAIGILSLVLITIFVRRIRTTIETRKQVREDERFRELSEPFPSVIDRPYEPEATPEEPQPRISESQDLRG